MNLYKFAEKSYQLLSRNNFAYLGNSRQFYKYAKGYIEKRNKPNVVILSLCGIIQPSMSRQLGGLKKLNLESLDKSIETAFATKRLKEICLLVNSPGGSPTQSELIAKKILRLSRSKNVDVISFVEDYAASGGYWLACAGKEIYLSENSIAGSIGALVATFGLHDFIKRFDIERRVYATGKNKLMMDPFQPEDPEHNKITHRTLNKVYQNFIHYVKEQRGNRLKGGEDILFTGEYWVGEDAVALGLADGIKTVDDYLYEKYGDKVNVLRINPAKPKGLASLFGSAIAFPDLEDIFCYNRQKFL